MASNPRLTSGDDSPTLRLFNPACSTPPPSLDHAWYDFGGDRHHIAVIPLDRKDEAIEMMPLWRVTRCELWYLCYRVERKGSGFGSAN